MIKNIIFDFGGVLVDWNPHHLYDTYFGDKDSADWFLSNICTMDWNMQMDAGKPFEQGVAEKIAQYPQWEKEIRLYWEHWIDMMGDTIPNMYDWILQLKQRGYAIYGLTNWSTETFIQVKDKYSIFQLMDGIVMSGEERVTKPDAKIYHILLNRYQLAPEECVFFDDNLNNVIAAQNIGIHAVQFQSTEQAKRELSKVTLS